MTLKQRPEGWEGDCPVRSWGRESGVLGSVSERGSRKLEGPGGEGGADFGISKTLTGQCN